MDYRQVLKNVIQVGIGVLAALVIVAPVSADETPGALGVNPIPMPLPAFPAAIQAIEISELPQFVFPAFDFPVLPTLESEITSVGSSMVAAWNASVSETRAGLNSQFSAFNTSMGQVRSTTNVLRYRIGSPLTDVQARTGSQNYTSAYSMAVDMASSMQLPIMFLRGLSGLGTTGLNLSFVFLGLVWLVVVNLLDVLVDVKVVMVKALVSVLRAVVKAIEIAIQILILLRSLIPLL